MGFNYSMQGKSPQQQAIVRKQEQEEERRKLERKKQNKIVCKPVVPAMDYRAVTFEQGVRTLLELRVSGTAVANKPCGLDEETIHQWLEEIGFQYIKKDQNFETVLINYKDVENGELKTPWDKLTRIQQ